MRQLIRLIIFFGFFSTLNNAVSLANTVSSANTVSLDQKIGQMVMVGFSGKTKSLANVVSLVKDIKAGKVGGVLFLGGNIGSAEQVKQLTHAMQSASSQKLLISIDQEGGKVRRLRENIGAPFLPSAEQMTKVDKNTAYFKYLDTAQFLKKLGFNVNFGPVVDLAINKNNPVIAKLGRSYGTHVGTVAQYAYMFTEAHHVADILTALKHFPGHGSSDKDSHKGFVNVSKSWQEAELLPFQRLIEWDSADMIMAAHVFLDKMSDDGKSPTSLSKIAITDILRGQLGFKGVVISDDMAMGAIAKNYTAKRAIIKAINAGSDIVMLSYKKDLKTSLGAWVHQVIAQAVANGQISVNTINQAYQRIMTLKQKLP